MTQSSCNSSVSTTLERSCLCVTHHSITPGGRSSHAPPGPCQPVWIGSRFTSPSASTICSICCCSWPLPTASLFATVRRFFASAIRPPRWPSKPICPTAKNIDRLTRGLVAGPCTTSARFPPGSAAALDGRHRHPQRPLLRPAARRTSWAGPRSRGPNSSSATPPPCCCTSVAATPSPCAAAAPDEAARDRPALARSDRRKRPENPRRHARQRLRQRRHAVAVARAAAWPTRCRCGAKGKGRNARNRCFEGPHRLFAGWSGPPRRAVSGCGRARCCGKDSPRRWCSRSRAGAAIAHATSTNKRCDSRQLYRRRFGIETSYRQKNQAQATTTSTRSGLPAVAGGPRAICSGKSGWS